MSRQGVVKRARTRPFKMHVLHIKADQEQAECRGVDSTGQEVPSSFDKVVLNQKDDFASTLEEAAAH